MRRILGLIFSFIGIFSLSGCDLIITGNAPTAIDIQDKAEIYVGETITLEYTLTPADAKTIVTFTASGNTSIVEINGHQVTGLKPGVVLISATTSNNLKDDCILNIKPVLVATSISLNESSLSLHTGDSYQLNYTLIPSGASETVSWASNNPEVVSVSDTGLITCNKVGYATIEAITSNNLIATCEVTVEAPVVSSIYFKEDFLTLTIDEEAILSYVITPTNAENKNVTFASSNEAIVSVDNSGKVKALAEGSSIITVTTEQGSYTDTMTINVTTDLSEKLWDLSQNHLRTGIKSLNFYSLNDTHGSLTQVDSDPGIAALSTYLKQQKANNPDGTIFTSAGDMWQGSADSNITRGALMIDWMNYLGFSAQAIGNHEFDWKIDVLKENIKKMNFPMLACNIIEDETGNVVEWVKPYTTITRNGVHIGIIGSIGEGLTSSILAANVEGLTFVNPTSYVKEHARYLKDNGADVILYITHDAASSVNSSLAGYVDLAFGGHTHTNENVMIGGSATGFPFIQAGKNGRNVGNISLDFDFSNSSITYTNIWYTTIRQGDYTDDQGTLDLWAPYSQMINSIKNRVVANYDNDIAYDEVPLIYDYCAYQYYLDNKRNLTYDIVGVFTNSARSAVYQENGKITYGAVYKALPFDNTLVIMEMKGSQIKNASSRPWYFPIEDTFNHDIGTENISYSSETYYVLTLDYCASNYYGGNNVVYVFEDESALPREIFSTYLQEYLNR